jgi:hypothetical protein
MTEELKERRGNMKKITEITEESYGNVEKTCDFCDKTTHPGRFGKVYPGPYFFVPVLDRILTLCENCKNSLCTE